VCVCVRIWLIILCERVSVIVEWNPEISKFRARLMSLVTLRWNPILIKQNSLRESLVKTSNHLGEMTSCEALTWLKLSYDREIDHALLSQKSAVFFLQYTTGGCEKKREPKVITRSACNRVTVVGECCPWFLSKREKNKQTGRRTIENFPSFFFGSDPRGAWYELVESG
jgi:hypothetical protein